MLIVKRSKRVKRVRCEEGAILVRLRRERERRGWELGDANEHAGETSRESAFPEEEEKILKQNKFAELKGQKASWCGQQEQAR